MMLYSAATQRAIDDKHIADGAASCVQRLPSSDVFSRFKQLNAFLFDQLKRTTRMPVVVVQRVVRMLNLCPLVYFRFSFFSAV